MYAAKNRVATGKRTAFAVIGTGRFDQGDGPGERAAVARQQGLEQGIAHWRETYQPARRIASKAASVAAP